MPFAIDPSKSPYGLSGGIIFSGSQNLAVDGFGLYTLQASTVAVFTSNLTGVAIVSGSIPNTGSQAVSGAISGSFPANIWIYGNINYVSQSSGYSVLYQGTTPARY